ncbi:MULTISPECIES: hypothetical protein [Clostridium]|uniref:Uncharacterized protein n=1 Tax=Clostridium cibarium TaxID=2762247 RepID=A0ABR8PVL5_9CLOT|nr:MULTISPECIES: hypothetical protein [Clostridium]MBD7912174.1 hypothetical protein [Clostridium cibarium]
MGKSELFQRVREKINFKMLIKGIGLFILLFSIVLFAIKAHDKKRSWEYIVNNSNKIYEYKAFNKKYISNLDNDVQELYKSARVLYGYSNLEHLSIESNKIDNKVIYGWDSSYSSHLINAMDNIIWYINDLDLETSYNNREQKIVTESLEMIRYFCNNQQLINRVRLKMDLIGNYQNMDGSIEILLIDEGGAEYFKNYDEKMKKIKGVFE